MKKSLRHIAITIQPSAKGLTNMFSLTLSLPEWMMEFCKVVLTFESVDKVLWCDHSNESSLPVLSHGAICLSKFCKMKFGNFCLILPLAAFGTQSNLVFRTFPLENMGGALPTLSSSSPSLRPYFSLSSNSHYAPLSERLEQSSQPTRLLRKSV